LYELDENTPCYSIEKDDSEPTPPRNNGRNSNADDVVAIITGISNAMLKQL